MIDLSVLAGGLIVSCQARKDNALHGPVHMSAAAVAAVRGGAVGIRAEGAADVAAIRAAVDVPIIGIRKILDGRPVYITPSLEVAAEVVASGADIVAVDASLRDRDGGESGATLIRRIREELGVRVMADIDGIPAAEAAAEAGADLISTTLSGYTGGTVPAEPDIALISDLRGRVDAPVVAEGRIWSPQDVTDAFEAGAWAVVVGTAVTNPQRITARLVTGIPAR
ncbi:putative N-acetylmannosamine-6-phosphate 2-epimerase [Microbacterium soli]|uniref:N-acylglucosamine-6-phosphate 2-epimerase n=1 Tax=Microbacterium soli TaxID=446075 RepID=A0ABP7MZ27_9MICO